MCTLLEAVFVSGQVQALGWGGKVAILVVHIVLCTGYHIDVPFLSDEIKKELMDDSTNSIKVGHWFVN